MAHEVTVGHAKTHLSELLRRVEAGEEVVIRRGDQPIARLVREEVLTPDGKRAIWGSATGGEIPEDFDDLGPEWKPYVA